MNTIRIAFLMPEFKFNFIDSNNPLRGYVSYSAYSYFVQQNLSAPYFIATPPLTDNNSFSSQVKHTQTNISVLSYTSLHSIWPH